MWAKDLRRNNHGKLSRLPLSRTRTGIHGSAPPPLRGRSGWGVTRGACQESWRERPRYWRAPHCSRKDDTIAPRREPARARVAVIRMLSTVDLDDELRRGAEEVDDIGSKRMLAAEAEPFELLAAQPRPQPDLGIRGRAAKFARERRGHASMVTSADPRRHPPSRQ